MKKLHVALSSISAGLLFGACIETGNIAVKSPSASNDNRSPANAGGTGTGDSATPGGATNPGGSSNSGTRAPAAVAAPSATSSRTLVVSPNGSPSGDGTANNPVDLFSARDLAAAMVRASDSGPVRVLLQGGTYFLPTPLTFEPAHSGTPTSPILFAPYGASQPVLSGALSLRLNDPEVQSTRVSLPTASGTVNGVWRVTVSGSLAAKLRAAVQSIVANNNNGAFSVGQVFQDGTPLTRSRHPNGPSLVWMQYSQVNGASAEVWFESIKGIHNMGPYIQDGQTEVQFTNLFEHFKGVISSTGYVNGQAPMGRNWSFVHFDQAMRQNQPGGQSLNPVAELIPAVWSGYNESGWLENNKYFIDSPGEWYFDSKELALYVIPQGNPSRFDLALGYNLIQLNGSPSQPVSNLSFSGLQLQNTNWRYQSGTGNKNPSFYSFGQAAYGLEGAIDGNNTRKISFLSNAFLNTGASGIALNGCRKNLADGKCSSNLDITIQSNTFTNVGGSAVLLDDRNNDSAQSVISGNSIVSPGRVFWDAPAVVVLQSNNIVIQNNTVHDIPYTAFHLGWRCNSYPNTRIELTGNTVTHAMTMLADGGDFYTQGGRGEVRNNNFEKAGRYRAPGFYPLPSPANDIYLDGYQTFWAIHDNTITGGGGVVNTSSSTTSVFRINGATTMESMWKNRPQDQWTESQCARSSLDNSALGFNPPNWWSTSSYPAVQVLN